MPCGAPRSPPTRDQVRGGPLMDQDSRSPLVTAPNTARNVDRSTAMPKTGTTGASQISEHKARVYAGVNQSLTLVRALDELRDRGDSVSRDIVVVCHGVEPGTEASLVVRPGSDLGAAMLRRETDFASGHGQTHKPVVAGRGDELLLGVETTRAIATEDLARFHPGRHLFQSLYPPVVAHPPAKKHRGEGGGLEPREGQESWERGMHF